MRRGCWPDCAQVGRLVGRDEMLSFLPVGLAVMLVDLTLSLVVEPVFVLR